MEFKVVLVARAAGTVVEDGTGYAVNSARN